MEGAETRVSDSGGGQLDFLPYTQPCLQSGGGEKTKWGHLVNSIPLFQVNSFTWIIIPSIPYLTPWIYTSVLSPFYRFSILRVQVVYLVFFSKFLQSLCSRRESQMKTSDPRTCVPITPTPTPPTHSAIMVMAACYSKIEMRPRRQPEEGKKISTWQEDNQAWER